MNSGLVGSLISHTFERLVAMHSFLSKTTTIRRFLIIWLNVFLLATPWTQRHTIVTTVPPGRSLLCFMSPSSNPTNLPLPHEYLHHHSFPPPSSHILLPPSMAPLNPPLSMTPLNSPPSMPPPPLHHSARLSCPSEEKATAIGVPYIPAIQ